jgi:hypothetical protein
MSEMYGETRGYEPDVGWDRSCHKPRVRIDCPATTRCRGTARGLMWVQRPS